MVKARRKVEDAPLLDAPAPPSELVLNHNDPKERAAYQAMMYEFIEGALLIYHYTGDRALLDQLIKQGRMPLITDEVKPWRFRGWLMPYLFLVQSTHPGMSPSYAYHVATLRAGKLLDEPIPEVRYAGNVGNCKPYAKLSKLVDHIGGHSYGYGERAAVVFIDWLCWALGVEDEEPKFINEQVNEYLYRNFNFGDWLLEPNDYLGHLLVENRSHNAKKHTGFFPTPHNICELMTAFVYAPGAAGHPSGKDPRAQTVLDPAVGTGRFLMHAGNHSMRLYGNDIDATVVKATKCNMAMYVPWGAWPLPQSFWAQYDEDVTPGGVVKNIVRADSLRDPPFTKPAAPPADAPPPRTPPPPTTPPAAAGASSVEAPDSAPGVVVDPMGDVVRRATEMARRAAALHRPPVTPPADTITPPPALFEGMDAPAPTKKQRPARPEVAPGKQPRRYSIHESQGSLFDKEDE